jgi:fibrillarin-like rRNA methylase
VSDRAVSNSAAAAVDPVRAKRAKVAKWSRLAKRIGYLLILAAIGVFAYGAANGFTSSHVSIIIAAMVAASILLAPSIVLGYAVKAAERDDRERGL